MSLLHNTAPAVLLARPRPERAGLVQAQGPAASRRRPLGEALETALGPALATITAEDAQAWFRLCGYAPAN